MIKYGNWLPKKILYLLSIILLVSYSITIFAIFNKLLILAIIFIILSLLITFITYKSYNMYSAFNYDDNLNSLAWQIIEFVSTYVKVKPNQKILDVGCGSGALTILCAKKNRKALVSGFDKWGAEYGEFSKAVCEKNAEEEEVTNTSFFKGDVKNLTLEKESFDFITSNYVFHNIPGNKQEMIINVLSLLKKGGSFAIHDLFSKQHYGNIDELIEKLREMGFEKVELIDTTKGLAMDEKDAKKYMLTSSKLLFGKK